ncbi:MAG: hypothetical protein IKS48_10505 [Eubacterium sp.]|nr:hypothetical protein [Eubacterium sp.]
MAEAKLKIIGRMDNTMDHTFELANRVYDVTGISPTLNTCGGGGLQPMILEKRNESEEISGSNERQKSH